MSLLLSSDSSSRSAQSYAPDARNDHVRVYLNGDFVARHEAKVSIFDSGYVCGDGVWEGLRIVNGQVIEFDAHIERLFTGASSIALEIGLTKEEVKGIVLQTFEINGMHDGAHARLMITRGIKKTANQDPRFIIGGATIVCVAEHKVVSLASKEKGLRLHTSTIRCSGPDVFDLRLNSHSRLNLIQALIQALNTGADEALMLDPHGFVSSCNSTNFFIVRNGALWTSSGRYCFNGITRATILAIAREANLPVFEGDYTLAETYTADEAFVTGTLGGLTPVSAIDGRALPTSGMGPLTQHLYRMYLARIGATQ